MSLTQAGQNVRVAFPISTENYAANQQISARTCPMVQPWQLTVSLTNTGTLVIQLPPGTRDIDIQSLVLTGLAAAKQKLNLSVDSIKSVVIVQ